ncbi:MAG: hypothetical protein K2X82_08370 [Gemmataceae bacterium]|nr:hypothetical protein [Gemmataceae bacterium]
MKDLPPLPDVLVVIVTPEHFARGVAEYDELGDVCGNCVVSQAIRYMKLPGVDDVRTADVVKLVRLDMTHRYARSPECDELIELFDDYINSFADPKWRQPIPMTEPVTVTMIRQPADPFS